jgi:hypothetical protein
MRDYNHPPTPIDTKTKLYVTAAAHLAIVALRVLSNILLSLNLKLHMLFINSVFTCRILMNLLIKCILHDLKGTLDHGITLYSSSSHKRTAYSDVDWAGCPDIRCSTLELASVCFLVTVFFGCPIVSRQFLTAV